MAAARHFPNTAGTKIELFRRKLKVERQKADKETRAPALVRQRAVVRAVSRHVHRCPLLREESGRARRASLAAGKGVEPRRSARPRPGALCPLTWRGLSHQPCWLRRRRWGGCVRQGESEREAGGGRDARWAEPGLRRWERGAPRGGAPLTGAERSRVGLTAFSPAGAPGERGRALPISVEENRGTAGPRATCQLSLRPAASRGAPTPYVGPCRQPPRAPRPQPHGLGAATAPLWGAARPRRRLGCAGAGLRGASGEVGSGTLRYAWSCASAVLGRPWRVWISLLIRLFIFTLRAFLYIQIASFVPDKTRKAGLSVNEWNLDSYTIGLTACGCFLVLTSWNCGRFVPDRLKTYLCVCLVDIILLTFCTGTCLRALCKGAEWNQELCKWSVMEKLHRYCLQFYSSYWKWCSFEVMYFKAVHLGRG